ncbi:MAG: DNA polymerase I [Selenomonadaceae bacterium]|nr:DNA polymerase I [Selenomonadaceae bacterium]
MKGKFVILDGSSLMYRAFYALPLLTASTGEYTNAIFGFSNMLTKLLQELAPDALAIAFDKGKQTFRNEIFPEYKGTRQKTPEELKAQIPLLHDFASAFGMAFVEKAGYEADDIIGTLATKAALSDYDTLVVTGDRDALQLVRKNLRVMLTKKGISEMKVFDEAAFEEEYQIKPPALIDLKGLMGDTSDNIPGVPGVGAKTATKLLVEYGTLENVLEHVGEIPGKKLKERLEENREQAVLSKRLATIECNVPDMEFRIGDYAICPNREMLREFCQRYELRGVWKNYERLFPESLQGDLFADGSPGKELSLDYDILETSSALEEFRAADCLSMAVSSKGKMPFPVVSGLMMALPQGKSGFVAKDSAMWAETMEILSSKSVIWVSDAKKLYHEGFRLQKNFFDLSLAAYLLDPEVPGYEIPALVKKFCPRLAIDQPFDKEEERLAWEAAALAEMGGVIHQKLVEEGFERLYREMEVPLSEVLAVLEETGVYVNRDHLSRKREEVDRRIAELEKDIHALAGKEFNINSPRQLGEILFERLGLPPLKKTKTGYSTNAEVLESLRYQHPIVERILSYRLLAKLKSTYLDALGELIRPETKRVHTSFNQTVTATGRLSSSNPNLQNIPVRTEEGKQIRTLFEPGEGYDCILSADYSQIELRLLAHMSGDEGFIKAFRDGEDIHARTAAEVFGIPLEEVTSEMRRKAKAVNFGIVYGISDYGLSRDLHIPRKEAAGYISRYFERYSGVKKFLDAMVEQAHKDGFVTTMFGRRRSLPAIRSNNFNQRSLAERMAMNTPIQGSAADIIKLAMVAAWRELEKAGVRSRILLQVHDELVLEVAGDEIEQVSGILRKTMEHVAELSVPLLIDIHTGKNWAEAK